MNADITQQIEMRLARTQCETIEARSFSLPEIHRPIYFYPLLKWDELSELLRFGLELTGTPGPNNQIILDEDAPEAVGKLRLELFGGSEHLVVVDGRHRLSAYVRLEHSNQTFLVSRGGGGPFYSSPVVIRGVNALVAIGADATSNGTSLLVNGDNTSITIGDDCMLAHAIELSATDSHAIFNVNTLDIINYPKSISVGRHVWIGSHVSILKGVKIGYGSMVGTRSLVTKDVPPLSLFAGLPARSLKRNVSWSRHLVPSLDGMRSTLNELEKYKEIHSGYDTSIFEGRRLADILGREVNMNLSESWTGADFTKQLEIADREVDQLRAGNPPPVFASFISLMKNYVDASEALTFLDCACTSGYYLDVIQVALSHKISYVGSDIAASAIELARARHPAAEWRVASVTALPFGQDAFDIVMASGVLEHVPDWRLALDEITRVAFKYVILHRLPVSPTGKFRDGEMEMYGIPTSRYSFAYHEIIEILRDKGFLLINGIDTYHTYNIPEQTILFKRKKFL